MKSMNYSLIRTICVFVIGLALALWPDAAINYIVIITGILFLIPGPIALIGYFDTKPEPDVSHRFSIEGAGSLLFGFWLVTMPGFFADALMFPLGFVLIMGDVQQIASLSMARRWMPVPGGSHVTLALILIAGVVALSNLTRARNTAFMIIGISSLVYAISELINWFKFARHRPKTPVKGEIEDAETIE